MSMIGRRVELVRCGDPYTKLQPGDRGTIDFVDSLGTVFVRWDTGSTLGLVREAGDAYRLLPEEDDR